MMPDVSLQGFALPRSEVDELTIDRAMELNLDDAMAS